MNILRFGRFKYHSPGLHFLSGFNAYVGYLLLEHTHSNPVLVTFCQLLIKTINDRQASVDLVQNEPCSSKFTCTVCSLIGSLIVINSCSSFISITTDQRKFHFVMGEMLSR